jgi:branched-chain amino acid transport system ATP-binding protein
MSTVLLEISGLSVAHGAVPALQDVSLTVGTGEITALVGANGAGKTTLLRAVLGLQPAQQGTVALSGRALAALSVAQRVHLGIGYAPEGRRVFAGLTVRENLDVAGSADAGARRARITELETLFPDLAEKAQERAWRLSGGQQQMLAVARALMSRPRLLLLDEPSLGLAPALVARLFESLRRIADAGTAILLAEQNLPPALAVADVVVALRQGRVLHTGPAAERRDDAGWMAELL